MKKRMRMMALALVASVALVGAGYAAWGNSITSTTNLNSGYWKVALEADANDSLYASDKVMSYTGADNNATELTTPLAFNDNSNLPYGQKHYDTVDPSKLAGATPSAYKQTGMSPDGKQIDYIYTIQPTINDAKDGVSFAFYNMHPGTRAITRFEARNFGSIPAKIGDVHVTITDGNGNPLGTTGVNSELYNAIKVDGTINKHHANDSTVSQLGSFTGATLAELEAALRGDLVNNDHFHWIAPKVSANQANLDSDEVEVSTLDFYIPASALKAADGSNLGMKANLKVAVKFDFVQYNKSTPAPAPTPGH